jgi:hypothetical protein
VARLLSRRSFVFSALCTLCKRILQICNFTHYAHANLTINMQFYTLHYRMSFRKGDVLLVVQLSTHTYTRTHLAHKITHLRSSCIFIQLYSLQNVIPQGRRVAGGAIVNTRLVDGRVAITSAISCAAQLRSRVRCVGAVGVATALSCRVYLCFLLRCYLGSRVRSSVR